MKSKYIIYLLLLVCSFLPFESSARRTRSQQRSEQQSSSQRTTVLDNDTVIEFNNPGRITIVESIDGLKVMGGNERQTVLYEQKHPSSVSSVTSRTFFSKKKCRVHNNGISVYLKGNSQKGGWHLSTGALAFGLNGAVNQPEGTGLQMGKSFEIDWLKTLALGFSWKNSTLSLGLGLNWKNFKMTGAPHRMVHPYYGGISVGAYPEDTHPLNSTLKIFSLQIPLLYEISVPAMYTKFSVGPILDFNTYSSLKTSYINGKGNKTTEFVKGLNQRPITFDIFASASWHCVGLYLKYAPLKAMRDCSDINFNPLSVGLVFFM